MTWIQFYAFVFLPVLIVAIGWIGVLLHERDLRRTRAKEEREAFEKWSQELA
jgi:hypothetical protein